MEEKNVNEIKKTIGEKIKENKKVIIVGCACVAVGIGIGYFGPKVIGWIAGAGVAAEPVIESGAEVIAEAVAAVA